MSETDTTTSHAAAESAQAPSMGAQAAPDKPARTEPPTTVFMGFTLAQAIFAISWPLMVIVGLYAFMLAPRLDAIEAAVRARPAIKVVNSDDIVRSWIAQGLDANAAISRADAQFRKMGEQGYVVLRNGDVLAAPKSAKQP